ncbi:MAG: hypothetical protein H6740_12310 [Alphaproteobacteria bacterium]|nr:hypothetical protein [Alphaproteobacteria bacterium]
MLFLLLLACQSTEGSWETLFQPVPVEEPAAEAPAPAEDPLAAEFAAAEALDEAEAGGWDDLAAAEEAGEPEAVEAPEAAAPEAPKPAAEAPVEAAPEAVGLATQPVWGLRLLGTIPQATPPRAAIGLPDGSEVVVAPGTLLPEVGVIVIAVGPNSAQIAKVTPAGDHATIESETLFAQYGGAASGPQ